MTEGSVNLLAGMYVFERGRLFSDCILFDDSRTSSLVDCGYCTHSAQTLSLTASKIGFTLLNFLLKTHLNGDYCSGNAALQARYAELVTVISQGQFGVVEV